MKQNIHSRVEGAWLDAELAAKLDRAAKARLLSKSTYIRQAIAEKLAKDEDSE